LRKAEAKRIRRAINLLGFATLFRSVAVGLFIAGLLALASNGGLVVAIVLGLLAVGCLFAGRACEREGLRTIH
jgi:amino acid transporter